MTVWLALWRRPAELAPALLPFLAAVALTAFFGSRFEPGVWYSELAKAPWTLMYTVARAEALDAAQSRLQWLTATAIIAMTLVAVSLLAVWIYGNSLRRAESAARYREMAERMGEQRNLLRLVTDSQPTGIFILDAEGRYRFANREAGRVAGIPADDLAGKSIASVFGPEAAKRYLSLNREVLESGNAASDVARLTLESVR